MSLFGSDRPSNYIQRRLTAVAFQLRRSALEADDRGHEMREWAFVQWRESTVYPQAVDRWLHAVGENSK